MKNKILVFLCLFMFFITGVSAKEEAVIDITNMDIFDIQNAIDDGLITYEKLVNIYIDRINEYNKTYNAVITINDDAIEEAKKCDINYKENGRDSYLYCMPILVKDNIDVVGMPTTDGTKSLLDNYPNSDATVISNLKKYGVIILGKTNMSEFAFIANSTESSFGRTLNAYNTAYESYGSSGGSAVSVALSFASAAIGTDTNLSIRIPAAANNLYGMRPTFGLLSNNGIIAYDITRDTPGPITKTARDNALLLAGMQGIDLDSYYKYDSNYDVNNITIGVVDQFVYGDNNYYIGKADQKVIDLFNSTIDKLAENGVTIIHLSDFYNDELDDASYDTLAGWTMCYAFNNYIQNTNSSIRSFSDLYRSNGHILSLREYYDDCNIDINKVDGYNTIRNNTYSEISKYFDDNKLDAIIYPSTNNVLSMVEENNLISYGDSIVPVVGASAISIPMGDIDGLYYGADILSLRNGENTLYDIANFYNQIKNTYVVPSGANNLYDIPDEVSNLVNYYLENKGYSVFIASNVLREEYNNSYNNIIEFFSNYNNIENKEETANNLLEDYQNVIFKVNNYKGDLLNKIIIIFGIIIILVICFIFIKVKVNNKIKRHKKYKKW